MPLAEGLVERAEELERLLVDASLDPSERVRELRKVRADLKFGFKGVAPHGAEGKQFEFVLGKADTYIAALELQREGDALGQILSQAKVQEDAAIRAEVEAEGGVADGLPSPETLAQAEEDGTLQEAFGRVDPALLRKLAMGRHRNQGQFADEFGGLGKPKGLKGRGGGTVPGTKPKVPKPPEPVSAPRPLHAEFAEQVKAPPPPPKPKAPKEGEFDPPPKMKPLAQNPGLRDAPGESHAQINLNRRMDKLAPPKAEGSDAIMARIRKRVLDQGLNDWPPKGEVAQRILGDLNDTQELHTAPLPASPGTEGQPAARGYKPERKPEHDRIVGASLHGPISGLLGEDHAIAKKLKLGQVLDDSDKDTIRQAASAARDGGPGQVLFMAGGPASGKSSVLKSDASLEPEHAVTINPDDIKGELPEYREMVKGEDKYAANGVHEESSDIAKRLQREAQDLGLNVVVDGTGDSSPGKFAGKLQSFADDGYEVSALYVTIPTEEAVFRAVKRALKSGRWVPEPELRKQHKNVSANFEGVAALPFLKSLNLFDTSGKTPKLIADGSGGSLSRHDPEAVDAFLAKATEGDEVQEAVEEPAEDVEGDVKEGEVPPEQWIQHPVNDAAEYLDRPTPIYQETE